MVGRPGDADEAGGDYLLFINNIAASRTRDTIMLRCRGGGRSRDEEMNVLSNLLLSLGSPPPAGTDMHAARVVPEGT